MQPSEKLRQLGREAFQSLVPPPPDFKIIEARADTFSLSITQRLITVPEFWKDFPDSAVVDYLRHEYKHGSIDGFPTSFLEHKRLEAMLMGALYSPAQEARALINIIGDAVINTRLHLQGYPIAEAQQLWCDKWFNPADGKSTFTLLQLIFQNTMKIKVPQTQATSEILKSSWFDDLLQSINALVADAANMREHKNDEAVKDAALAIKRLVPHIKDVCHEDGKTPPALVPPIAEIGISAGLDAAKIRELLEVGLDVDVNKIIEEAIANKARMSLWEALQAFEVQGNQGSERQIYENVARRWHGRIERLDPLSFETNRYEPDKWREDYRRVFTRIPAPSQNYGFSEVAILTDISSSTFELLGSRMVYDMITEASMSLLAYARRNDIPATLVLFAGTARTLIRKSKDYLSIAKCLTRSVVDHRGINNGIGDGTTLSNALSEVKDCKDSLIGMVTDGSVEPHVFAGISHASKNNRVIAVVVSPVASETRLVENAQKAKIQVYQTSPDEAGRLLIKRLHEFETSGAKTQ